MSAQVIPLKVAPSQTLTVQLGGQSCRINVRQFLTGLFVDLYVNDAPVICGVLGLNNTLIVREAYRGFAGDLIFWDTQGSGDPSYDGLGARFVLLYIS
jgi:hypothetical protein